MQRLMLIAALLAAGEKARAQEPLDELGEAQGLGPAEAAPAFPPEPDASQGRWRHRGHLLLDGRARRGPRTDGTVLHGPNAEVGLAVDGTLFDQVLPFFEGRLLYEEETHHGGAALDQGGVRWRPAARWTLALGKERSRRAPGLIVSPSDFIHSSEALPGLRQERGGVWLGRASWQTETQSVDLVALPVSRTTEGGMPARDSEYLGSALRYFGRYEGYDVGLDLGAFEGGWKAGAFAQTFLAQVWKVYAEGGYDSEAEKKSWLGGVGYEGSNDFTARAELFDNDHGSPQGLFGPYQYLIASATAPELANLFNLTETLIRCVDNQSGASVTRGEWLVSDRNLLGVTYIRARQGPFDWQALVDWKTSF